VNPADGTPCLGSFRGSIHDDDLRSLATAPSRLLHEKRWVYAAMATEEVVCGLAVVDLGYALNGFAFVHGLQEGRMLADQTALGLPGLGRVRRTASHLARARLRLPGAWMRLDAPWGTEVVTVDVKLGRLALRARLDASAAPPALTAVVPVLGGVVNVTEKRALLTVTGEVEVEGRRFDLAGGVGGYDYSHGLLARQTRWRWAFLLGKAPDGTPLAVNLVEGFVGEPECGAWLGRELYPLAEGRFTFNRERPLEPWTIVTADGGVSLRFTPASVHREEKDLGVVRSRFLQPVGTFQGTVTIPGRGVLEVQDAVGVVEDQDVAW
jgi:hypothetical protein